MSLLYDNYELFVCITTLAEMLACASVIVVAFAFVRKRSTLASALFGAGALLDLLACVGTLFLYFPYDSSSLFYSSFTPVEILVENWEAFTPLIRAAAFGLIAGAAIVWGTDVTRGA